MPVLQTPYFYWAMLEFDKILLKRISFCLVATESFGKLTLKAASLREIQRPRYHLLAIPGPF